jgi:spore coat protein CotH
MRIYITILLALLITKTFSEEFFTLERVHETRVYFYDADWDQKLNVYQSKNSNERVLAKVIIDEKVYDSVGIRFKGNSSYHSTYLKNPFNFKFNYKIKKQKIEGHGSLRFNNLFKDPSGIREALGYDIAGKYMPAPKCAYSELYINDKLVGLYLIVEPIDKKFLKTHFENKKGTLIKCDPQKHYPVTGCPLMHPSLVLGFSADSTCYMNSYELKSKYGWNKLMTLLYSLWYNNTDTSKYYNSIESHLNIDQTLWMLAFNNVFVNLDSYTWSGHNYYIYEESDGKFRPIIWDLNECFGTFHPGIQTNDLASFDLFEGIDSDLKPLISHLLVLPEYRAEYMDRILTLKKDIIDNVYIEERSKELHNLIDPFIKRDPWFYYGYDVFKNSLFSTHENNIPGILELMKKRSDSINSQIIGVKHY